VLSWINFRWLKGSVQAFGSAATAQAVAAQSGSEPPKSVRVPAGAYVKFFARIALLLGALYVILTHSWLPAIPVLAGIFAAPAATVLALVFELLSGGVRPNAGGS